MSITNQPPTLTRCARPLIPHCSEFSVRDAVANSARPQCTSGKSCIARRLPAHLGHAANLATADPHPARILPLAIRVESARTGACDQSCTVYTGTGATAGSDRCAATARHRARCRRLAASAPTLSVRAEHQRSRPTPRHAGNPRRRTVVAQHADAGRRLDSSQFSIERNRTATAFTGALRLGCRFLVAGERTEAASAD